MRRIDEANDIDEEVLVQGDTYEDDGEDVIGGEEGQSDTAGKKPRKLLNINEGMKPLIIVGAIIVVLLIIVATVVFDKIGDKSVTDGDDVGEMTAEVILFEYTQEEIETLRLAGYTGNEIEAFEYEEQDAQTLIDEAEAARRAQYEEEIAPFYEGASDEFKNMWNNSWVGQPDLEWDTDENGYSYYTDTINVDYVKLTATGHQLFIKFYLKDGDVCFMSVTPERYVKLDDNGNIVLSVSYTQSADEKVIITDVTEVNP